MIYGEDEVLKKRARIEIQPAFKIQYPMKNLFIQTKAVPTLFRFKKCLGREISAQFWKFFLFFGIFSCGNYPNFFTIK
jgi:hypothetical protein